MAGIDRLGWAEGITFTTYGVRAGVRLSRSGALEAVRGRLPPDAKPARGSRVARLYSLVLGGAGPQPHVRLFHVLYADAARVARTLELEHALDALESDLQLYVAEAAPRHLFVHAGVVAWHGRAIVMPGRSLSGKTSLVAALVRAGATYYSDEYAVLDGRGRVHPYARPLGVRENGPHARATKRPVETLGGRAGTRPLPVALVLASEYRPGARWRPKALSAAEGALELLAHTVAVRRDPQRTLSVLQRAVSGAELLRGVRGEAASCAEHLLSRLAG